MKNPVSLSIAVASSFFATLASAQDQSQPLSVEQRIDIVQEWYATRDYSMLADELDWRHAPGFFGGETLTTREQVEEDLAPFYFAMFESIAVEIDRVEASEQSVFSFGTYVFTPRNSSTVHRAPFIHVWTVNADGQLDTLVQYADTYLINRALADARVLPSPRNE